jgi:dienelactone hydrolase
MHRISLILCLPALLSAAQPANREMNLTTPDGFVLKGTLTVPAQPGPRPVVILAHPFQEDRNGWKPLAGLLNAKGIATLALDLRGHGQSTRKGGATLAVTPDFLQSAQAVGFDQIPADLAQAAAWVRRQPRIDPHRLGLAGASVGGFASLLAAPAIRPIAVLTLSPAGNGAFGPDALAHMVQAAQKARSAELVLAAEDDTEAAGNAKAIEAVPGACARIVPGQEHGFAFLPGEADVMAGWFAEYLNRRVSARPKPAETAEPAEPAAAS